MLLTKYKKNAKERIKSMSKKIKKRKFNFKKFFKFIITLVFLILLYIYFSNKPIKNILVKNTYFLTDEQVIEAAGIDSYPSFLKALSFKIKKNIKKLPLVKDVKVKKKLGYKVVLEVTEYKVLFKVRSTNEFVLDKSTRVTDLDINAPILINYAPEEITNKLIRKFLQIDQDTILKISEIEYSPTVSSEGKTIDDKRFTFYMNDGNIAIINTINIDKFNNYLKVVSKAIDTYGKDTSGTYNFDSGTSNVVFQKKASEENATKN